MTRHALLLVVLLAAWASPAHPQDFQQPLFRYPDTLAPITGYVRAGTRVDLVARYDEGGWLYVAERGGTTEGWLPLSALSLNQTIDTLPILSLDAKDVLYHLLYAGFDAAKVKPIMTYGLSLGNRIDMFSKVGDSITVNKNFLTPLGAGVYDLGEYTYLQAAIDFFGRTPEHPISGFDAPTVAAGVGWASRDLLKPADDYRCPRTITQLECEYSIHQPAAALIMIGTNDAPAISPTDYARNLKRIVELSLARGVIPILSTIPPQPNNDARVDRLNLTIVQIADDYDVPLMNYWLALQDLPERGLNIDGIHPSSPPADAGTTLFTPDKLQYGYTVRNWVALHALYYLLTEVYSK